MKNRKVLFSLFLVSFIKNAKKSFFIIEKILKYRKCPALVYTRMSHILLGYCMVDEFSLNKNSIKPLGNFGQFQTAKKWCKICQCFLCMVVAIRLYFYVLRGLVTGSKADKKQEQILLKVIFKKLLLHQFRRMSQVNCACRQRWACTPKFHFRTPLCAHAIPHFHIPGCALLHFLLDLHITDFFKHRK